MADTKTEGHEEVLDFAGHHPHVVPLPFLTAIFVALLVLTGVTVGAAEIEMGDLNVPVAMFIATIKATLVAAYFMHLRWGKPFNVIVLLTSIGFLALFLIMTVLDTSEYQSSIDPAYAANSMQAERDRINAKRKKAGLAPLYAHDESKGGGVSVGSFDAAAIKKLREGAAMTFGPMTFEKGKPLSDPKVKLGQMLFFEPRLSKNQQLSCNSCHGLDTFGQDGKPFSPGHKGQLGGRNSPTVYNAFKQINQFWDGRRPTVEAQAKDPILNPVEMAMPSEAAVVKVLKSIPGYVEAFKAVFPKDGVTYDNMANAIGAFERKLITRSKWDEFMEGKDDALTEEELQGLKDYMAVGCATCHAGPLLGGQMLQKSGLREPWPSQKDQGLYEHTKQARDKMIFKASQLRNIAETGPFFHDGQTKTLAEAVDMMAKYQLAKELKPAETKAIVAFLKTLTGKAVYPELTKKPELPKSGPNTPKADPN